MGRARRRDPVVRLRQRFVIASFGAISVALIIICTAINVWNYLTICQRADDMTELIYRYGGVPDRAVIKNSKELVAESFTAETPFETRYFIAVFDEKGELTSLDAEHIAALDQAERKDMARELAAGDEQTGFRDQYRFAVFSEAGQTTVVVLDCFGDLHASTNFRRGSIAVCGTCALIALALLIPFSRRAVSPIARNLESQRRFVTDASHELKTPIAIIAANNDLLEDLEGENRWTQSTRAQVERLNHLVNGLVELARAEEPLDNAAITPVDLSDVVRRACTEASPLAEVEGKVLACTVEDAVVVNGSELELAALTRALLDNAVKYCTGAGPIDVALAHDPAARSRVHLTVSNPCSNLSPDDMPHLFDRFWRSDTSRARKTGGYGIGLAMVQAVARKHRGGVGARLENGRVTFTVTLPAARP